MQRHLWRALLLAMAILMLGALPVLAQTGGEGRVFDEDSSIVIGIQNDVSLATGEEANAVVIVQGNALIEGTARGLLMIDADVTVEGVGASVEGVFAIGGTLTIADGASVKDVAYIDTEIVGADAITGELADIQTEAASALALIVAGLIILIIFLWVGAVIAMLAMSLLVVAFGTNQARRAAFNIGNDVLKTIVVGVLMLIVPPLIMVLLAITIVGIPLAFGLFVLWAFVGLLGYIVVGLWIGERILSRARMSARPYGAAFLGVLILLLLAWLPFVSWLAWLFGYGAVTLAGWRVLRGGGAPYVPPGYGQGYYGQPQQVAPPPYAPPPYAPPQGQYPPPQGGPPSAWPQG